MTTARDWMETPATEVVLFGNREFASLAWHVVTHDSSHRVVGFTVDRKHIDRQSLHSLPIVAFDEVERHFDPARCRILMSVGWIDANGLREARHKEAVAKGYSPLSYISSRTLVWPDAEVGNGCMIFEGAIVQPFARIGNGVILRSGCHISHHVDVGDFCFVSAHAAVGGSTSLASRCFIGLNATIGDNIDIGSRAIIGAGAVVLRDIEAGAVHVAPPARRVPGLKD